MNVILNVISVRVREEKIVSNAKGKTETKPQIVNVFKDTTKIPIVFAKNVPKIA